MVLKLKARFLAIKAMVTLAPERFPEVTFKGAWDIAFDPCPVVLVTAIPVFSAPTIEV